MSQPPAPTADKPLGPGLFRYSLQGLLIAITFLAIGLAVTNWRMWDTDERWILRCWFAGALGLAVLDRVRGSLGIFAAAVGGGIPPALITMDLWQSPSRYAMPPQSWMSDLGHDSVVVVLIAGAIAGALAASACCLARRWPGWFSAVAIALVFAALNWPGWLTTADELVRSRGERGGKLGSAARLPLVRHLPQASASKSLAKD